MSSRQPIDMLAGVELGGTKCICILGTGPNDVRAQVEIATTTPAETFRSIRAVLAGWTYDALGIASFGPLDLDPASSTFGSIVNTPKPGWSGTDLVALAGDHPFLIDTDVNGAALAEGLWGAARGLASWAYVTIGTGIGVGSIVEGRPIRGLGHSEAGHMRVPRCPEDQFTGLCPYHGDCVEGLANGPAIEARTGMKGQDIPADHPVWRPVASALTYLCHNLVFTTLPQRILIGGGVGMGQAPLLSLLRQNLPRSLGDYGVSNRIGSMDHYLCHPALADRAGPLGALALATMTADPHH